MTLDDHRHSPALPRLTSAVLAGLVLRPWPEGALRPLAAFALEAMSRRHGSVFARLAPLGGDVILIDPVELPFAFALQPGARPPALALMRKPLVRPMRGLRAAIRGPLALLVDLAEGRLDGDALFFSRALEVEGDAEAVVMLRNALESADIRVVDDVLSALGPFAPLARGMTAGALALLGRAADDLEALRRSLLGSAAPAERSEAERAP